MEDNFFKEGHNYDETYLGLLRGFKRILDKYPLEPISSILNGFDGIKDLLNTYTKTVIKNNLIDGCVFLLKCDETNNPPTVIDTNNFRVYVDVKHPYKTLVKEFHFTLPEDFDKLLENTDVVKDGEKHTPYFDIVDENGVIYEISLGQKYANNQNCKKAETNITVEAIMDNQIIKSSNNKYYRLVGQNDVKPYTEVSKIDNNYELIDLLMKQNDVVKVITANSNTGQFYVLKKDGNVHSYIVSKANRNDPIVITSIKKVYDKNDFDSSIVDFSYAGESLGTFVRTEKSVYRMKITNSKTCKKYADVACEFKMEKDPIFDEYKENIIAYNGVNLITNYNQVFSVAN